MNLTDLLYAVPPRQALAIATGLSIVLYALISNLVQSRRRFRYGRLARISEWTATSWIARSLGELARWLYYLGLPYATLMLGYNTARALGVWNLDWIEPLPSFAILLIGSIVSLTWVWRPYARTEHPHALDESRWNRARHVVELIYQQAHWAFYRSGPILWLGDVYLGSFVGLALTLLEAWSNPGVRKTMNDTTRADAPLWTGSLAIVATIVFIFTQNFWYCLVIHLFLDLLLRRAIGFPQVPLEQEALPATSQDEVMPQFEAASEIGK